MLITWPSADDAEGGGDGNRRPRRLTLGSRPDRIQIVCLRGAVAMQPLKEKAASLIFASGAQRLRISPALLHLAPFPSASDNCGMPRTPQGRSGASI